MAATEVEISVIVPTCGRKELLARALASVMEQDAPRSRYEVIVVNNGPEQGAALSALLAAGADQRVRLVEEKVPGLLAARHRGAREARSDLLVFVDDDIVAAPSWLSAILETFEDSSVSLVTGPCLPQFEFSPPEWVEAFTFRSDEGWRCGFLSLIGWGARIRLVDPIYVWGLNFAIRRESLLRAGGFHPDAVPWKLRRFRGDGEIGLALKCSALGMKAAYHPSALVRHYVPAERLTIEYFERRAYLQGISNSYAAIRRGRVKLPGPRLAEKARSALGQLRWNVVAWLDAWRESRGKPYSCAHRRTMFASLRGTLYHQREVRRDPALLEWVLKPDYWDYRLPASS